MMMNNFNVLCRTSISSPTLLDRQALDNELRCSAEFEYATLIPALPPDCQSLDTTSLNDCVTNED